MPRKIVNARSGFPMARRRGVEHTFTTMAWDLVRADMNGLYKGTWVPNLPEHAFAPNADKVVARVNHGRWLADCPTCRGAELVDVDDRRFFCLTCFNVEVDHRWRRVDFPPKPRVEEIEAFLEDRPVENQNWLPGEDIAQLVAENIVLLGRR